MSIVWIIFGVICLIPIAWLALVYFAHLMYWLLATNIIEYLIYPAIILSGAAGIWMILHGTHTL
jgi:hypothetical protein